MKYENMTVEQFVEATNTVRVGDKVGCSSVRKSDAPAYSAYVKAHKPEIMAYLLGREKAAEERQAKIGAIEGLKEVEAAEEAVLTYREAFVKAMERGDGILPSKPDIDLEALMLSIPAPLPTVPPRQIPGRLTTSRLRPTQKPLSVSSTARTTQRPSQTRTPSGKPTATPISGTDLAQK